MCFVVARAVIVRVMMRTAVPIGEGCAGRSGGQRRQRTVRVFHRDVKAEAVSEVESVVGNGGGGRRPSMVIIIIIIFIHCIGCHTSTACSPHLQWLLPLRRPQAGEDQSLGGIFPSNKGTTANSTRMD